MPGETRAAIGGLSLEATVVLAGSRMSAGDVERARRDGSLRMDATGDGIAYLEAGGVIVAEGRMKRKHGKSAFVVTRTFSGVPEVLS
jgi:hypothetical protein